MVQIDMDMPKSCETGRFAAYTEYCHIICFLTGNNVSGLVKMRDAECPLVEVGEDINVTTKTGRWIWKTEDKYYCSCCNEEIAVKEVMNVPQYEWCPMCGAKMEVQNEQSKAL